jgi:tRNA A-37 threonylcarbamoyl transferase component Bud32
MQLRFIDLISGDGGFANVWRAWDEELHRDVAVKIIREASIEISNAVQHARALARARHPNVVVVHAIEKVTDPDGSKMVDAVIMELLSGQTVGKRLQEAPLSSEELRTLGLGTIAAVRHIHAQGMVHGDLHEHNVMISGGQAKVIDLLHRYSLALVSLDKRAEQVIRELRTLKTLVQQLVAHSELSSQQAYAFTEAIRGDPSLDQLQSALCEAVDGEPPVRLRLEHPKTPLNLFDLVIPGLHRERVRGLLGAPDFVQAGTWIYRYQETQVEVRFTSDDAVDAVIVALCWGKKYFGSHPTAHTERPLGELTFADVLHGYGTVEDVQYFQSLRTREVYVQDRWGPSGAWSYYACGALDVSSGVGLLAPVDFEWDESASRLVSDPGKVLINWMAATAYHSDDVPAFNWYIKG